MTGHDRSDGGLLVTVLEMAFASHAGVTLSLSGSSNMDREAVLTLLFSEAPGLVFEVPLLGGVSLWTLRGINLNHWV